MHKNTIILLSLLSIIIPLTFVFAQEFFNPFQYGIKTVKEIKNVVNNLDFRKAVREKAAELLNEDYGTTTFTVQGERIVIQMQATTRPVPFEVIQNSSYKTWENLIKEAANLVLSDCDLVQSIWRSAEFCHWKVVRADIVRGQLQAIYIAPSGYSGAFPRVSPCEKGIGQCLLFFFDRALRIVYFATLALGVIFLMLAGILYITKPSDTKSIHQRLIWGIVGIIVGITSFTIVIGLENWLAGGLTTTGGPVVSMVSKESGGVGEESSISIRKVDVGKNNLNLIFDVKPPEGATACQVNITATDEQGNPINLVNPQLDLMQGLNQKRTISISNLPTTVTTLHLNFNSPNCSISPSSYTAQVGQPATVSPPPRITIDTNTSKIDESKKFSVFVFAEAGCKLKASFYNLTKSRDLGDSDEITIDRPKLFIFQLPDQGLNLGDTIRVIFNSPDCTVSVKQLDIRTAVVTGPTKNPTINLTIKSIYGQQTIRIDIKDLRDIKNILERALGVTVVQRNLYDPPFSMYITYNVTVDNQPPPGSGFCTIYGRLRGIRINQLSFDKTKAISYTAFNRDFSFYINYEPNRKGPYNIPIILYLPDNILGFINLELYNYTGQCDQVKIGGNDIAEKPFNATYDIETAKFYSVSGNILGDLFGF